MWLILLPKERVAENVHTNNYKDDNKQERTAMEVIPFRPWKTLWKYFKYYNKNLCCFREITNKQNTSFGSEMMADRVSVSGCPVSLILATLIYLTSDMYRIMPRVKASPSLACERSAASLKNISKPCVYKKNHLPVTFISLTIFYPRAWLPASSPRVTWKSAPLQQRAIASEPGGAQECAGIRQRAERALCLPMFGSWQTAERKWWMPQSLQPTLRHWAL